MMKKKQLLLLFLLFLCTHSYALPPGIKYFEKPYKAVEIGLMDTDGNKHSLADYRGNILIVNFWGLWCQPCRKEMPSLQRAYEQLIKDNISIIAIAMGDSLADLNRYKKTNPVGFALLSDRENIVSTNWLVPALPTSYIVNKNGDIIIRLIGEYEWDNPDFLKKIKALNSNQ